MYKKFEWNQELYNLIENTVNDDNIFIVSRLYPPKKSNIGFIITPPPIPAVAPILVAKIAIKKYNICICVPPIFNIYT